ncbi:hypothetical protein [Bifidobacterium sp.]
MEGGRDALSHAAGKADAHARPSKPAARASELKRASCSRTGKTTAASRSPPDCTPGPVNKETTQEDGRELAPSARAAAATPSSRDPAQRRLLHANPTLPYKTQHCEV